MTTRLRVAYTLGIILNILGSLLPWGDTGGTVGKVITGITIYLRWSPGVHSYPGIEDNGGLLVILLSLAVVGLAFRAPRFVHRPAVWAVRCSILLILLTTYHIGWWALHKTAGLRVSGPSFGLWMVLLGSCILLIAASRQYRRGTATVSLVESR